jgi:hypothetical protein
MGDDSRAAMAGRERKGNNELEDDQRHFAGQFRRFFGVTPGAETARTFKTA